jgi:hypothetical protein
LPVAYAQFPEFLPSFDSLILVLYLGHFFLFLFLYPQFSNRDIFPAMSSSTSSSAERPG